MKKAGCVSDPPSDTTSDAGTVMERLDQPSLLCDIHIEDETTLS